MVCEGKSWRYDNQSFEPSQWHPSNDTTMELCLSQTFDCTRIIRLIISILPVCPAPGPGSPAPASASLKYPSLVVVFVVGVHRAASPKLYLRNYKLFYGHVELWNNHLLLLWMSKSSVRIDYIKLHVNYPVSLSRY